MIDQVRQEQHIMKKELFIVVMKEMSQKKYQNRVLEMEFVIVVMELMKYIILMLHVQSHVEKLNLQENN